MDRTEYSVVAAFGNDTTEDIGPHREMLAEEVKTDQAATSVGEGVVRSTGPLRQMTHGVVVLRRVQQQNRFFFILTSYPVP